MKFEIQLLETTTEITKLILEQIKDYLEPRLDKAAINIQNEIKTLLANALRQEPEYQSLISGQLKAELGIPDSSYIDNIIIALVNTLQFTKNSLIVKNSGLAGGFKLTMIKSEDLGGVINNTLASIDSFGGKVPWLEWLTLKGNEILVKDYKVQFGSSPYSRSGMAIMIQASGSSWRVPAQFTGTQNNNWITRAIERIENNVYDLIIKSIEKEI